MVSRIRLRFLVLFIAALALGVGSVSARTLSFPPQSSGVVQFKTPAGDIGCTYIPAGGTDVYAPKDGGPELQCDRIAPVYLRFFLYKTGKAQPKQRV